jgi:hypothetical protein
VSECGRDQRLMCSDSPHPRRCSRRDASMHMCVRVGVGVEENMTSNEQVGGSCQRRLARSGSSLHASTSRRRQRPDRTALWPKRYVWHTHTHTRTHAHTLNQHADGDAKARDEKPDDRECCRDERPHCTCDPHATELTVTVHHFGPNSPSGPAHANGSCWLLLVQARSQETTTSARHNGDACRGSGLGWCRRRRRGARENASEREGRGRGGVVAPS